MPSFNPAGGTSANARRNVTITAPAGSKIRYTVNGTIPTRDTGTPIASNIGTVTVTATADPGTTLRAIAYKDTGASDSGVQEATFTLGILMPGLKDIEPETAATSPAYDLNGNLTYFNGSTYTYDAQNRLTNARNGGTTATFYYDGKNRQIARNINNVIRISVWDGWELIEEYASATTHAAAYLQGSHGVIKSLLNNIYYYQDKMGSTTHVASATGQLLESYKYDLYGIPRYINETTHPSQTINSSNFGVADLYAGERWIPELGLYDLRNRFISPELGRFLQPDPIGFKGDASNLYRYCHNDPEDFSDPTGLVASNSSIPDRLWMAATFFDSGNNFIGSLLDFFKKFLPAGMEQSKPVEAESKGESTENPHAFRGARVDIKHDHHEGTTTDPIIVAGRLANAKTERHLGPPTAVVGPDGKIHFSQTVSCKTTYHPGASAALKAAEKKRIDSVEGAKVALDTAARVAAEKRYFSGPAQAQDLIGRATASEWARYLLESSALFEFGNQDGGTK
jgi:RHS repeat-associated protein